MLLVVDRPGWAIDRKAQNLRRTLSDRFELVVRYEREVTEDDLDACDVILIFYWLQVDKMPISREQLARRSDRLLLGICSHFELEGERRAPGLLVLNALPTAVFAINAGLVRDYRDLIDHPVHETPNGVDTSFFTPWPGRRRWRRRRGTLRVGWAGSLTNQGADHRGVDSVIRPAVEQVDGATFEGAIREERWRTAAEMRDFYRGLDVYVCASRSEGGPNPCLEAAACGIPIVTTPVGAMPEVVRDGDNGLFFDGSVEQLVDRLERLRDAPRRRDQLAAQMLSDIRQWDWRILAERFATMFDEVVERAPRE